jgi:acid stress-induced BolA-like protein IbaG/YrbA
MEKLVKPPHGDVKRLLDSLDKSLDPIDLLYEIGDGEHLHLWILSEGFEGASMTDRTSMVRPQLDKLPYQTLLQLTLFFPLTHGEFEEQFGADLGKIEEPGDNPSGDGPFRLPRPAAVAPAAA